MEGNKGNQEICVIGRFLSLDALVLVMGIVSFVYGLVTLNLSNILIGALILIAAVTVACTLRRIGVRKAPDKGRTQ